MLALILPLLLSGPGLAQDEAPSDDDLGLIDIDDIDLGDGESESLTYTGAVSQTRVGLAKHGARISITHSGGTIKVRCTDSDQLTARIDYKVEGPDEAAITRFGKGIGLSVSGSGDRGAVRTRVPARGKGVSSADVPLVVSVPPDVRLTIQGGPYWIEVSRCKGSVTAANRKGDLFVQGEISQFKLTAADGSIVLKAATGEELSGSSSASAPRGDVHLELPLSIDATISARGKEVYVFHPVQGTVTPTRVQGTIGAGGPKLTVSAGGRVEIVGP